MSVPILVVRRLAQLTVLVAFIAIPFLNKKEIYVASGNLLAFNLSGLPLGDPLAALQVIVGTGSAPGAMVLGACLVLLLALLLGPVFCGWICPFGLLSETVHGLRRRIAAVPDGTGAAKGAPSATPFLSRLAITVLGLVLVMLFLPVPVLNQLSLPGWYTRAMQQAVLYGHVLLGALVMIAGVLAVEAVVGKRLWCRYVCPQSVLISLASLIVPGRMGIRFEPKKCTCKASDRPCLSACSLCLNPRNSLSKSQQVQCTNCGDCVTACRSRGRALSYAFGEKKPEKGS